MVGLERERGGIGLEKSLSKHVSTIKDGMRFALLTFNDPSYRIHRETRPEDPTARSKSCPTATFLAAMRFSLHQCGETNVDLNDVISMLASLIDQVRYKLFRVLHCGTC
jgi:hypothetical protein